MVSCLFASLIGFSLCHMCVTRGCREKIKCDILSFLYIFYRNVSRHLPDCQHYIIYNSGLLHLYYYSYCTLADIAIALSMYNPSLLKKVFKPSKLRKPSGLKLCFCQLPIFCQEILHISLHLLCSICFYFLVLKDGLST